MNDLAKQYVNRYAIMQKDIHNLRAQRQQAQTAAERKRIELAILDKGAELLTLRREALTVAGVVL